jgi:CRISPR system Cascade subunit CasB
MTTANESNWQRVAREWWEQLQPSRADDEPNPSGDRGALARLRRAGNLAEIMAEEATLDLYHRFGFTREEAARRLPRVAAIVHVLAHVRSDEKPGEDGRRRSAIAAVGRQSSSDEDSAKLKPIRFRRLLAARDNDELMREMRRLVALADRTINVGDLAASLLWWNDTTRTRWAFDYHAAGMAAPPLAA